jgi:hypothetical protein
MRWGAHVLPCYALPLLCWAFGMHLRHAHEACTLSTGCRMPQPVLYEQVGASRTSTYWAIPSTAPRYPLYVWHSAPVCAVRQRYHGPARQPHTISRYSTSGILVLGTQLACCPDRWRPE